MLSLLFSTFLLLQPLLLLDLYHSLALIHAYITFVYSSSPLFITFPFVCLFVFGLSLSHLYLLALSYYPLQGQLFFFLFSFSLQHLSLLHSTSPHSTSTLHNMLGRKEFSNDPDTALDDESLTVRMRVYISRATNLAVKDIV